MKLTFPKLSALSNRERFLAVAVLLILSALLLDRVVLGPWWRHVQAIRKDILRLETGIRAYQKILSRKPEILAEVEVYSAHLRRAEAEPLDIASLLREIEEFGKQSGVSLGEVRPSTVASDESQ